MATFDKKFFGLIVLSLLLVMAVPVAALSLLQGATLTDSSGLPNDMPVTDKLPPDQPEAPLATRDMRVEKSLNSGRVITGGEIEYRIYFKNEGNSTAANVFITDTLPVSLTYVSDRNTEGFTAILTGSQVVWSRQYVDAGKSGYLYLSVRVTDTASVGNKLNNVVQVSTSDPESDPTDNVYTRTTTIVAPLPLGRDMSIAKSLDGPPGYPGGKMAYRIDFANQGSLTATNVVITDILPVSLTLETWQGHINNPNSIDLDQTIVPTVVGNQVVWNLGEVVGGGDGYIRPTVRITQAASAGNVVTNVVWVSTGDVEIGTTNNIATRTTTLTAPTPDMYISKYLSGLAGTPGGRMTYQIYFANQGNAAAANAVITDILPVSVTFDSWYGYAYDPNYIDLDQMIAPTIVGNQVVWNLGTVTDGEYGYIYPTVRITQAASAGDVVTNVVRIATSDVEVGTTNNVFTRTVTLAAPSLNMYVSKALNSSPPAPGGLVQYRIDYRNLGYQPMSDVVLTDTLPSDLTYVSHSASGFTATVSGNTIVFARPTVDELASGTLYVTARVADTTPVGTVLTNVVVLSTSTPDNDLSDNDAVQVTAVVPPTRDMNISKSLYSGIPVTGGQIQYRITYLNQGNLPASNVVVTDTLPAGVTYVSDGGCSVAPVVTGNQVVWRVGPVDASAQGYLYPIVRIADTAQVGDVLTNVVQVSTSDVDIDSTDNVYALATTVVPAVPDMKISKSVSGPTGAPGSVMVYQINYSNQGALTATNVIITDTLPGSVTYLSHSAYGFTTVMTGSTVVLTRSAVAGNLSDNVYIRVRIDGAAPVGGLLSNVVKVSSDVDVDPSNNVYALDTTVASPSRDMYISKSMSSGSAITGTLMTYSIYFVNQGNLTTTHVVITDVLPVSVTFQSWSGYTYQPDYVDLDQTITPTVAGNQVVWDLGTVAGSGYGYIYPTVRVADTAPVGARLANRAVISTDDTETDYTDNASAITHTVIIYGGPDALGYTFKDNTLPGGPGYFWRDATDGAKSSLMGDDGFAGPVPIGFNFPFYGNTYNGLYFSTNGLVTFGVGSTTWSNVDIPHPNSPNNFVAPFWDDLQVCGTQAIYYKQGGTAPNRYFVTEWHNVSRLGAPSSPLTFEAVLYESGLVLFQYQSLAGILDSNTVGIENSAGEIGLRYSYNQARLANGRAIAFAPPGVSFPDVIYLPIILRNGTQ